MSLADLRHEVMWANMGQSQICETKEQKLYQYHNQYHCR